jgi:glycosyltransferase involved in cell wall biosynthesis
MLRGTLAAVFLPILFLLYAFARRKVVVKPAPGNKPRLLWAGAPLINMKYASEAMRQAGYASQTMVYSFWRISQKTDFDLYRLDLLGIYRWMPSVLVRLIEPYVTFVYSIFKFDIFHYFFDGGILSQTPLRFVEIQLLHLFRKKVVVMPYGADVHVLSRMRNPMYKFAQLYHYGRHAVPRNDLIARWIAYFSRHADCCIGHAAFDSLYRWDLMPVNYISVDTSLFKMPADYEYKNDGHDGTVTVVHSPNHRIIKGTEYINQAVEKLKSEGVKIEFRLLEGMKNDEVRDVLKRSDILVELLISGYGLSGIEGMSLGKPVISNFQGDTSALWNYSYLRECPIVQANVETIYEKLKWLIENPAERRRLGEQGRRYAEKYHSYVSQRIIWGQVYKKIWYGEDVDLMLLFHPLLGRYTELYSADVQSVGAKWPESQPARLEKV